LRERVQERERRKEGKQNKLKRKEEIIPAGKEMRSTQA
jgi:hypothetical protein